MQDSWSRSASGFIAGGQIGYNYQFQNNVVVGLEADIEWSDLDAKTSGVYDDGDGISATVPRSSGSAPCALASAMRSTRFLSMAPAVPPTAR